MGSGSAVVGALGGGIAYLSAGAWTDGLRSHADNAGATSLYGLTIGRQAVLHLIVPTLSCCVTLFLGGAVVAFVIPVTTVGTAIPWVVVAALIVAGLRAMSSVKGPIPVSLLLPVPTPIGDMSIVVSLAWTFDGFLLSVAALAALCGLAGIVPLPVGVGAALLLAVIIGWTRRRLMLLAG